MKLLNLYVHGFGKFHGREITFQDGLNIVYGKNEAGKSTLHTFIRGMLFGMERQRGRASKNDLRTRFKPWENSGTYEGRLRVEHEGHIYRFERNFQTGSKEFSIIDETLGKEIEPSKGFLDELLCGLSETAYNNTISIGQLKSATDGGMVTELKNYIANLNTSGSMALNVTKATAFLKNQRREAEAQMTPEAARTYASLLSEIRNVEKEIASPEYENQIHSYQSMGKDVKEAIEQKQREKEALIQKVAKGRQILASNQFADQASITAYLIQNQQIYEDYLWAQKASRKEFPRISPILAIAAATLLLCAAGFFYYTGGGKHMTAQYGVVPIFLYAITGVAALAIYLIGAWLCLKGRRSQKELSRNAKTLQEVFFRYLGDPSISQDAMNAFQERMAEFTRLSAAVAKSEAAITRQEEEINQLKQKGESCIQVVEKQQRAQWELEKKLEHLANCKTQAEGLKHLLAENDRIREELAAIDLALETMANLSTSIRDSFGLYLNKEASDLISGITGGIYSSMSVDENLKVFLNTKYRMVPVEQLSSGTMDQIYLALRLAVAKLIQKGTDQMPLIFDDSFILYDDDRLKTALRWLVRSYQGQIIIFTCHQREAQMLTANLIPYHFIEI